MKFAIGALLLLSMPSSLEAAAPRKPESATTATDRQLRQAVDTVATAALADNAATGFVVGIASNGQVRLIRGYGFSDLEHKIPVDANTVFRIGSITKEFTAAAILRLAEQGRLSIDDPIAKYLPDFPRGAAVTIRNLLNHTSGVHNYTALKEFLGTLSRIEHSTQDMVAVIAHQNPLYDFEPGTSYSYSNSGFYLLGAIIEKVSGQPYPVFLKANILDPAGLKDTKVDDLAEIVPDRASGYEKAKDAPGGFENAAYISMSSAGAAGAIRSTAADMIRWHEALLGGKILKPESLALMTAPGRLKDGRVATMERPGAAQVGPASTYGFGLTISRRNGHRGFGHGGSINGFNASLITYPDDKLTVVLLTNTGGGTVSIVPKLTEAVFAVYGGASPAAK